MVENMCAEVLLTGLLWINNKSIDLDQNKNIYFENKNHTAYVIPDKYSLIQKECYQEKISNKIPNGTMKEFLTTLN